MNKTMSIVIVCLTLILAACAPKNGVNGKDGARGPMGFQGDPGPAGQAGVDGLQGIQGIVGPQGIQGQMGPDGPQGLIGPAGIQGIPGQPGTVVTFVRFCTETPVYPTTFPEYGLCLSGNIFAVYSANGGFGILIPEGNYSSQGINSACSFTIGENCEISH